MTRLNTTTTNDLVRIDFSSFFDRKKVERAVDRAEIKQLSRAGAFIWRAARQSIRRRKKVSDPGKPPSAHGDLYKRSIVFGYEATNHSVVIGPSALIGRNSKLPETLEFGGTSRVRRWDAARGRLGAWVTVVIRPRPHMQPAFEKEIPKFPQLWKNSIT